MEKTILKKVQLVLLEIAKEIKRVCDANNICYFLDSGTLLGAVRHSGFIPWDDDLDIGMMREDYEKFCEIAPKALREKYYLQTWTNDDNYALPFAKIRKRNTVYMENKANKKLNNGFYVDIFPYDRAPVNAEEKKRLMEQLAAIERVILMKCHYQPWNEANHINIKKRIGYIPYQIRSATISKNKLISKYMGLVEDADSDYNEVYIQYGGKKGYFIKKDVFSSIEYLKFEDELFSCPVGYKSYLEAVYGNYMELPPIEERENRHQIIEVKF